MIQQEQARELIGATAYDESGDKIGKIGQVFLDDQTGQPEFATVNTGLFGTKETFVPIADARYDGDAVMIPVAKTAVSKAPKVNVDAGHLSEDEEATLYRHYGMQYSEQASDSGLPAGYDESGAGSDDAMTRSEERLRVDTERVEAGRARLRKYVVTEEQQVPVTTTREEVRLEREPITEGNRDAALDGPAISEDEHEVVLHEERPVVQTEAVPVERVRLSKEQVSEQQTVSGEVRKEQIDLDSDRESDKKRSR